MQCLLLQADLVHLPAPTLAEQQRTAELSQQLQAARSEARTSSLALRDAQQDWAGIVRGLTQDLQVFCPALPPLHCTLPEGGWGPSSQQSACTSSPAGDAAQHLVCPTLLTSAQDLQLPSSCLQCIALHCVIGVACK